MKKLLVLSLCIGTAVGAQDTFVIPPPTETITMLEGGGALVKLGKPTSTLFIADSCVAEVQAVSESLAFVTARNAGQTSFFALNVEEEVVASFKISVLREDRLSVAIEDLRDTAEGAEVDDPC